MAHSYCFSLSFIFSLSLLHRISPCAELARSCSPWICSAYLLSFEFYLIPAASLFLSITSSFFDKGTTSLGSAYATLSILSTFYSFFRLMIFASISLLRALVSSIT